MKSLRHNENGAAVIEFAILLFLLMPLLFGIIDFGFIWAQSHYLSQATREGARAGARIATYDSGVVTNPGDVVLAVKESVETSLFQFYSKPGQLAGIINKIDTPELVTVGSQKALKVSVTINSDKIWTPVLWQFLSLIPSSDKKYSKFEQLTDSAVFPISNH
ncbi:MAG: pilus assembly protein [Desulfuromonadales bacterium]|nr:pilus assembly protein [Desulfuromonadales bacterium]